MHILWNSFGKTVKIDRGRVSNLPVGFGRHASSRRHRQPGMNQFAEVSRLATNQRKHAGVNSR